MDRTQFFHFAVVNSMYCMWVLCVVVNGFILMHPDFLKARATLCLHTETQSGTPNHPGTSMRLI